MERANVTTKKKKNEWMRERQKKNETNQKEGRQKDE